MGFRAAGHSCEREKVPLAETFFALRPCRQVISEGELCESGHGGLDMKQRLVLGRRDVADRFEQPLRA